MIITLFTSTVVFADKDFEINQKNCNLPVKKIRELAPKNIKQIDIYRQCIKKDALEKWSQKSLVSK